MARGLISDLLQQHCFMLYEAAPVDPLALPMLTPLFGFSSVTAPEIQTEVEEISEANWYFKKKVIKGASASNITLERGITFYDSDFWRWMIASLTGDLSRARFDLPLPVPASIDIGGVTPRRSLLLVHFMTRLPGRLPDGSDILIQSGLEASAAALGSSTEAGGNSAQAAAAGLGLGAARGLAFSALGKLLGSAFEFAVRLPAKAWLLHGCIPVRYKAATDFDAKSSEVSIQQLELAVEMVEEISLAA